MGMQQAEGSYNSYMRSDRTSINARDGALVAAKLRQYDALTILETCQIAREDGILVSTFAPMLWWPSELVDRIPGKPL